MGEEKSTAITEQELAVAPPQPNEPVDPVLAMIERAARDPTVDVDKFERLMAMSRSRDAERARLAYARDFAALLPLLPIIDRNGRIVVYSKADREKPGGPREEDRPIQSTPYARFDDILQAILPTLGAHGFSIRFEYPPQADGRLVTTCFLQHAEGHFTSASTPPLKHDTTGSKNDVQAVGSALSYGMRYALRGVVPIVSHAPEDRDDDGRAAGSPIIDEEQRAHIKMELDATKSDVPVFLRTIGASSLEEMTVAQYQRGLEMIRLKKERARQS